jgi:hypothetical protein
VARARATPRKGLANAKLKRGAKKVTRKRVKTIVETVVVDVVEEPIPGVTVVTEIEATEVPEGSPDELAESRSRPSESEEQ